MRRLDREGRQSADDAHREMWELGEMPDIKGENDFRSFCVHIGREFVLENIETIFEIKKED